MKKIISIDLDGVLNNYCGNYKEDEIDSPRDGAKEFLENLSQEYRIEIFTVRNKSLVSEWLKKNELESYITNITNIKNPYSFVFIDDRAINFDGSFYNLPDIIRSFKPHWK